MRPKQIETLSLSYLEQKLGVIAELETKFERNDKTPFLDGNIFIYNVQENEQLRKDYFTHEVRVQIKGTTDKSVLQRAKDEVEVVDLKGFEKIIGGGCFYIIVCISDDGLEKIYYYDFQPFELKQILKEKGHQKTITFDLKEFPSDHDDVINLLKTFAINLKLQSEDVLNANLSSFSINEVSIKYHGKYDDYKKYLDSGAVVYAKTPLNISVPVGQIIPNSAKYYNSLQIKLESKKYLNSIIINNSDDEIKISIENYLSFLFEEKRVHFNFQLDKSFTLRQIANCINNLEEIFRNGFYIGPEFKHHVNINHYFEDQPENLATLYEFREELTKIILLLETLEVDTEIKYHLLEEDDKIRLHNLLKEFSTSKEKNEIVTFELEKKLYYFLKSPKKIGNLFKLDEATNVTHLYKDDNEKYKFKTFASLTPRDELQRVVDFDFEYIEKKLKELFKINKNIEHVNLYINDYLLCLITAYDKSNNKKFLNLAEKTIEMILYHSSRTTYLINYYQILKRKRDLSFIEKKQLSDMLNDTDELIEIVCIKILLNQASQSLINKLDQDVKNDLMNWPIYTLYES